MGCPCKNKKKNNVKVSAKTSQTITPSSSVNAVTHIIRPKTTPTQSGIWASDKKTPVDVWLNKSGAPDPNIVSYTILIFRQEEVGQLPVFLKKETRMVFKGNTPQIVLTEEQLNSL